MPFAEHTGLIGPLTRYILDKALAQAHAWCEQGHPRTVAVNLSARSLLDEGLADQVAELLTAHDVAAELFVFEVTESAVVTEPSRAQQLLKRLSALGIGISIDDFGAGYTSLGQLKTLPVSELKIDRSFVTTMTEDGRNALIVQSVIGLGHNLGLSIVAEGVEDERTLTALAALDCDIAQGYHIASPMSAEALDAQQGVPTVIEGVVDTQGEGGTSAGSPSSGRPPTRPRPSNLLEPGGRCFGPSAT
jgi:EAL domain-containing protein (putative c-di-GMP-specific phosphodiesterase class I)